MQVAILSAALEEQGVDVTTLLPETEEGEDEEEPTDAADSATDTQATSSCSLDKDDAPEDAAGGTGMSPLNLGPGLPGISSSGEQQDLSNAAGTTAIP